MGSTDEDDDDDDERHPLCVACVAGRLQKVDSLLAAGEDPNVVGSQRTTPLFIACERECPELVAMLLAARADPDLPAFGGATPLFIASTRNQASIAGLLVDANAQLDFVGDNDYYTPLLACTKRGSDDVAKVRRPPRPAPPTPSCAVRPWSVHSSQSPALSLRPDQVLLQRGASVHLRSDKWGTLLHSAAAAGHVTLLKLLVAAGAALDDLTLILTLTLTLALVLTLPLTRCDAGRGAQGEDRAAGVGGARAHGGGDGAAQGNDARAAGGE